MPFNLPFPRDVATYIQEATRDIQSQVLLGGPHDPMSLALGEILGMQRSLLEGDLERLVEQEISDVEKMSAEKLYLYGANLGFPLRGASSAKGFATIKGSVGTIIPTTLQITTTGGTFKIDVDRSFATVIPAVGSTVLPIVSIDTGDLVNQLQPGQGVLSSNIPGLETYVTNIVATGGTDQESYEQYKARLQSIEKLGGPPGSVNWFLRRVMRYPGVTRVCLDTCGCCDTLIGVYAFFDGSYKDGIPPASLVSQIQAAVFGSEIGSTEYGSNLLGMTGQILQQRIGKVKIKYVGIVETPSLVRNQIETTIVNYLQGLCPGAKLCKATLLSLTSAYGLCPSNVVFEYNTADFELTADSASLFARCNVMPQLEEVCYVV